MKNDWQSEKIGNVATPVARAENPVAGKVYRQIGVRLWGEGAYERETVDGSQTRYPFFFRVEPNDIVVNKIWARNGSVAVVPNPLGGSYVSSEFPTFAPNLEKIEPRWFHWVTKTKNFWERCDAKSRGTSGKNRIRPELFLQIEIPLPPLPEQQRIVARIEELARRVEEAQGLRRAANEHTDLLFYAHAKQLRAELLNNFESRAIGEITTVTSGGTPDRQNPLYWQNGTIAWVKTGELVDGEIWDSEEKITEEGMENSSARMFPVGTVLIALYGQGQTRGRTGLLKIAATTNQACAAIFPQPKLFDSRYLQVWLQSLYHEMRADNHGGAQPNWNGGMIKQIKIALPPLAEQHRIVAYLDGLQQKVDELRRLQTATQKELDALMPSILAKAFAGEL